MSGHHHEMIRESWAEVRQARQMHCRTRKAESSTPCRQTARGLRHIAIKEHRHLFFKMTGHCPPPDPTPRDPNPTPRTRPRYPPADTSIGGAGPSLLTLRDQANWRYVEFFTANHQQRITRAGPCTRPVARFFAWCENRGLSPHRHSAVPTCGPWLKKLQGNTGRKTWKQKQLAAVRPCCSTWLKSRAKRTDEPAARSRALLLVDRFAGGRTLMERMPLRMGPPPAR